MKVPPARDFFFPRRPLGVEEQNDVETRFFRQLRLPNGTYKTTYANRLPDVDAALCELLVADRTTADQSHVHLLDVGVSSGITTRELLEAMEAHGIPREAVAVDLSVNAYLRRVLGVADVLVDSEGHVLQLALPFVTKGRPHDPAGSPARALLQQAIVVAERIVGGPGGAQRGQPVRLISPRLLRRPDVTVVEHDLTRHRPEWDGRFDVVRAANVLNLEYFDEGTLSRMLGYLAGYLRPGGLLVVVRTHDDTRTNHATIFRLVDAATPVPVARINEGSEVEPLVATAVRQS